MGVLRIRDKKTGTFVEIPALRGAQGKDGMQGNPGEKGDDGITPHIGDNGNWFVGETDTGKPSRGEKGNKGDTGGKGDTGATGAKGAKGDKGDTPVKGVDYWTTADKNEMISAAATISGAKEGSIIAADKNGKTCASGRTIASLGTGATYKLSGGTLYITTL